MLEPPGCRWTNGILFCQQHCCIQLIQYKNKCFQGEHMVMVPQSLAKKLIAYMKYVRPAYGMFFFKLFIYLF